MKDFYTRSFEIVSEQKNDEHTITGRAIHYDAPTLIQSTSTSGKATEWYEVIDKTALVGCDVSDVPLTLEHDRKEVIARSRGGSLKFEYMPDGFYINAKMLTQRGREVWESVKAGLLTAFSFAFPVDSVIERDGTHDNKPLMRIKTIRKLLDVSVVYNPAYPGAFANARSADVVDTIMQREQTKTKLMILLNEELRK